MTRKVWGIIAILFLGVVYSCSEQEINDAKQLSKEVAVKQLPDAMKKVRDYVPDNAVLAHRGTTYWAPEETEAAFRWARDMGADYLEADLQVTKDNVLLALHDDNLTRTTNIEEVFGDGLSTALREARRNYYKKNFGQGASNVEGGNLTDAEIEGLLKADAGDFAYGNYKPSSYTYEELMMLDCGGWFNKVNPERARNFGKQFASTLEDLVNFSRGKMIDRKNPTERKYTITDKKVTRADGKVSVSCKYKFEYVADTQDSGNRPGIYIEFKEPWLNPKGFEQMVYDKLKELNMNIIENPSNEESYKNGKVNVGNSNGKVILQSFSLDCLTNVNNIFKGKVPMCFLLWKGNGSGYMKDDGPEGYASYINLAIENNAHFTGPSIGGKPNNYYDLLKPWQADLTHRAGLKIHSYSFDSLDQMKKYYGDFNYGNDDGTKPPYTDAVFTNRTEISLQYLIDKGLRDKKAPQTVPNPNELLTKLGY
ncbi:MAG: hypothetical protein KGV44_04015 [Flavobacteriaceae bacterium]|nr:hypothetical protein [Flavobacteriaceae bacterium]